jgi:hypothetical protein
LSKPDTDLDRGGFEGWAVIRRIFRQTALVLLGLLAVGLLALLFIDYRERVARGEQVQRDFLGRVIATRDSMVKMYPGIVATDGGASHWIYRLEPGRFEREMHSCLNPPIKVDNSGQRDPILRENTRECFLVNREVQERPNSLVGYQIILGDSTLQIFVSYP